ncbi:MAG: hypothetical protein WA070_19430 [Sphingobium sp.]
MRSLAGRTGPVPVRYAIWPLCAALLVLLLILVAFGPLDHDEGQYVGAVAMMRYGLPYRDFAYLQTPLQPLLFAPLAWGAKGWLFPALRVVNAVLATGAVACVWLAARRAGASDRGAAIAALALSSSHMLLFAGSVARNDALPLLLMTAGLAVLIGVVRGDTGRWSALLAGIMLAGAASAKISYGLPAAAVGLFALLHWRSLGVARVALLALGGGIGALPTIWMAAQAWDAAWFGIIDYSIKAPVEWRTLNGQAFMLDWPLSLVRMVRYLAQGCGLIALIALLSIAGRRRRLVEVLLDMVIVAGMVAAWLPRPIYVQYLGPVLPALFIRFALLADAPFWRQGLGHGLIVLCVVAGLGETAMKVGGNIASGRSPMLAVMRDVWAIDRLLPADLNSRVSTTVSTERIVDAALPIDRRFVTGPFLLRTRNILSPHQARAFHLTTSATLVEDLDAQPPAAILAGGEGERERAASGGLDAPLEQWARRHGYRPVPLPSGRMRLYLPPR